jgi:hypothetical protein
MNRAWIRVTLCIIREHCRGKVQATGQLSWMPPIIITSKNWYVGIVVTID